MNDGKRVTRTTLLGGAECKILMEATNPGEPTCQCCHKPCAVLEYEGGNGRVKRLSECCLDEYYSNVLGDPIFTITKQWDNYDQYQSYTLGTFKTVHETAEAICDDFEQCHLNQSTGKEGYFEDVIYSIKYKRVERARNKHLCKFSVFQGWDNAGFLMGYRRKEHLPRMIEAIKSKVK